MRVFILKEGKEYNQGVAYLDDGTMVVVDNAKRLISKTVDITVTSVLQTTAGKMIFGKYDERSQSSGRPPERQFRALVSGGFAELVVRGSRKAEMPFCMRRLSTSLRRRSTAASRSSVAMFEVTKSGFHMAGVSAS